MHALLCAIDAYLRMHPLGPEDISSVGGRQFPNKLSIYAFEALGHTITFIGNWVQCFSDNDG